LTARRALVARTDKVTREIAQSWGFAAVAEESDVLGASFNIGEQYGAEV